MVTKSEVESLRSQMRKKAGDRAGLLKVHGKEIDDFHRKWKEKLSLVRIEGTNRIKPYRSDKEKSSDLAKRLLIQEMDEAESQRKEDIKLAEEIFRESKKKAVRKCEGRIEAASRTFNDHSQRLAGEFKAELQSAEKARDVALEGLKGKQDADMKRLLDEIEALQAQMSKVSAA